MTINYSKQVLVKRGNTAVSSAYTGPLGEITLDTDLHQLRLHDGETAGGWLVPSGQDFEAIQANIATLANIDVGELANIAALFSNAASQQETIQFLVDNSIEYAVGNLEPAGNETLWFNTDDGRLYAKDGDLWVDASPATLPTPSYIYNTLENVVGNIIPDANNTYSLGSPEAQWKDLWVSNATIYLDQVPLSTDVTGNLTYNGAPLVSLVDGNLAVGGTVITGTGGGGNYGDADVAAYLFNNRIQTLNSVDFMYAGGFGTYPYMGLALTDSNTLAVRVNNSSGDYTDSAIEVDRVSKATTFYGDVNLNSGNLVLPGIIQSSTNLLTLQSNIDRPDLSWTITSGDEGGIGVSILSAPHGDDQHVGELVFSGTNGGGALVYVGTVGTPFDNSMNIIGQDANVKISTGFGNWQWTFGTGGNLTLPNDAKLGDTFGDGGLTLQSPPNTYAELGSFDGNVYIWASDAEYEGAGIEAAAYVVTRYNTPQENRWAFGSDGATSFPNYIFPAEAGSDGQVLVTDNIGRLTWQNQTVNANNLTGNTLASGVTYSSLTSVGTLTGVTSSGIVHITNTEDSIDADTGSLQVDGGAHVTKNLIAEGTIYAGVDAFTNALTNPLIVASSPSGVEGGYSQIALLNNTAGASGDYQVFVDGYDVNVSDTGWADFGMTGSNFNDENFTITGKQDGYIFVSAREGGTGGGNLVLATDSNGQTSDIIFGTGGFSAANIKMRLSNADNAFYVGTVDQNVNLNVAGSIYPTGSIINNENGYLSLRGSDVGPTSRIHLRNSDSDPTSDINVHLQTGNGGNIFELFQLSSANPTHPFAGGLRTNSTTANIIINTDNQNTNNIWAFGPDGVLNLPSTIGDIKRDGVSVLSGAYVLPTATDTVLGGVKVDGATIVIDMNGVISATGGGGGGGYTLPAASYTTLGGVKIDNDTILIDGNNRISANIVNISGQAATVANGVYTVGSQTIGGTKTFTSTIIGNISGSATTAATLTTARNINGVAFNGSGDITIAAAAGTLTGSTLNAGVTQSSLTSVGTLVNLTVTNTIDGNISGSATKLQNARNINGVPFDGTADITIPSTYGDSNVAAFLLTSTTITSLQNSLQTLNANVGAFETWSNANVISLQNQITGANTNIQTLNANLGAYQAYANLTFTTYSNANVIANLQNLTTNVTTTANVTAANLIATGNVFVNGGQLRTTATTANVFSTTATTVNIAGGATIGTYIGNASGITQLYGNVQGSTNGFAIGYRDIPQLSFTGNTTIALSDAGKHYYSTQSTNYNLTVANNSTVSFSIGTAINIVNQGTGTISILPASGVTMYLAGNSTSGSRTLGSYGMATLQKVATDTWFVVGVGVA